MYVLGGPVALGVKVRDAAQSLVNATTISLAIVQPDGTLVSPAPTVTNPPAVTGTYTYTFTPTQEGRHVARWTTTGPATNPFVDAFDVSDTYPPLILSLAEAKAHLNIDDDDSDDELRDMLEGITEVVENGDGQTFRGVGPVVTRTVTSRVPGGMDAYALPWRNVISLTSGVYGYLYEPSIFNLASCTFADGVLRAATGTCLPSSDWTLTYVVGLPSLPANIRKGALEILKDAWNSQRGNNDPITYVISYRARAWLGGNEQGFGFA